MEKELYKKFHQREKEYKTLKGSLSKKEQNLEKQYDKKERIKKANIGRDICNGKGSLNVVNYILSKVGY